MAGINCETLRLNGNHGANNVACGLLRNGFQPAKEQTTYLSTRHPSWYPADVMDPMQRCERGERTAAVAAANRAGRLGASSGVVLRHSFAIFAKQTILSRWSRGTLEAFTHACYTPAFIATGRMQVSRLSTHFQVAATLQHSHSWPGLQGQKLRGIKQGGRIPPVQEVPSRVAGGR
jgi:hypothetical protein